MAGILYVVGTPIGNLSDFSPRAVETLQQVDFIAAEDTRVTLKLLNHFGIKKSMVSYYEHRSSPAWGADYPAHFSWRKLRDCFGCRNALYF